MLNEFSKRNIKQQMTLHVHTSSFYVHFRGSFCFEFTLEAHLSAQHNAPCTRSVDYRDMIRFASFVVLQAMK